MSEINAESTTMPPVELRMPRASERRGASFKNEREIRSGASPVLSVNS